MKFMKECENNKSSNFFKRNLRKISIKTKFMLSKYFEINELYEKILI